MKYESKCSKLVFLSSQPLHFAFHFVELHAGQVEVVVDFIVHILDFLLQLSSLCSSVFLLRLHSLWLFLLFYRYLLLLFDHWFCFTFLLLLLHHRLLLNHLSLRWRRLDLHYFFIRCLHLRRLFTLLLLWLFFFHLILTRHFSFCLQIFRSMF